jgi:phosphoglycolate phosphatase
MKSSQLIIFDLDGTLVDSAEDIAHSVNEVRERFALPALPVAEVEGYIGNGVRKLLERALPDRNGDGIDRAHAMYLPIYRRRLLDNTEPYPGVVPALEALDTPDRTLGVLTNKPRRESMLILEGLGLHQRFAFVYGGDSFEHKKPDPVGVHHLLEEVDVPAEDVLFVGDTGIDLETARRAGVRCCLVTYGIRRESLASLEPDFWVDDLRELTAIVGAPR